MLSLDEQNRLREEYRRQKAGWRPATEVYANLVRTYLRPGSVLLDLGCGRGGLVEQLGHPLSQIVGIDPDLSSLREHRLPLPRAQAISHRLPLAAGSVDLAFSSWVLEHLPAPQADFAEISRVLRPGGTFIFLTPNKEHPLALLNRFLGRLSHLQGLLVNRLYGRAGADTFPTWYRANSPRDLRALATGAGLQPVSLEAIADPTYLAFTPLLFRMMQQFEKRVPAERQLHLVGVFQKVAEA
jgi:SAM-dependent methyltransferase